MEKFLARLFEKFDRRVGNTAGEPVFFIKHVLAAMGCRVDLHLFVRADADECYHSHPSWAIRLVLWGGYVEEIYEEVDEEFFIPAISWKRWRPGMVGLVRPEFCHRIEFLPRGRSYSLWLRGPVRHEIRLVGDGWGRLENPQKGSEAV